jgi:IMP dehydrogenase/GMP reductase
MTVKEAISMVRVMLGQDVPTEKVSSETFAEAVLVDDTVVYTEGDLAVGATLKVKTETGEELMAPIGKHETKDGLIVTVGEAGVIEAIEEVAVETVEEEATEEVVKEEMEEETAEEELTDEEEKEESFNAEELLKAIAALIAEYSAAAKEEMNAVKEEVTTLTERFNEVADLPAGKPVRKDFMEEAKAAKEVAQARFDRLARIRNNK